MPEKGVINTKQYVWLLFIIITSVTSVQVPAMLIFQAGRDAWLAVIGGWFLDVLVAILYAYLGVRFPGENLVQYSITVLGKYLGRIVGILFPLFFLLVCTSVLRGISQEISLVFLPRTPFIVILASCFLVSAYIGRKGVEVIARITELLGPLYFLSSIVLSFLLIPFLDIERLKPQFDEGVAPFLVGSHLLLPFFGICIMMGMLIPLCNKPENGFLAKFFAVSMGALYIGLITAFSVGIFGVEEAKNMYDPGLSLARMVHFPRYLERIEIFSLLILVGSGIVASANMLWAFSLGVAQIAGLKTYQPLVYPAALVCVVVALVFFPINIQQTDFMHYTFPIIAIFVESGLALLLFAVALISGKRGTA